MIRKIIKIDEEKCNGCGLCAQACHEGAIEIIDGKAKLISDEYCDGLGNCLPQCPTGAIEIIEKDTVEFNEEAVRRRMEELKRREEEKKEQKMQKEQTEHKKPMACGCPGSMAKLIEREKAEGPVPVRKETRESDNGEVASELRQWPVQLSLVSTEASYLDNADLLIAADCVAYAYANFHRDFIKGRITLIGCPKLDDIGYYTEKLTEMFRRNNIKSITVVRMQVPCCGGIVHAVKTAMLNSQTIVPYSEVIITPDGRIL